MGRDDIFIFMKKIAMKSIIVISTDKWETLHRNDERLINRGSSASRA